MIYFNGFNRQFTRNIFWTSDLIRELMNVAGMATPNHVARSQTKLLMSLLTMCFTIFPSSLATYTLRNVRTTRTQVWRDSRPA